MQTKNTHSLGRWKNFSTIFVGMPVLTLLIYFGYCLGLWGRQSLLLQYLFQCNCPSFSEEWRYPKLVDIVVPACSYVGSILSPTGNLLYVIEAESQLADTFSSTYLLDFRTREKIPFFIGKGSNFFLTDDLFFLSLEYGHDDYEGGEYILDRTTGTQYPIKRFAFLRKDAYINREPNLEVLAMELQEAQDVYFINNGTIVALKSDFRISPEHSFYIDQTSLPGYDPESGKKFLQENDIDYHTVPKLYQVEAVSPDGRFIARRDGIYLTTSGEKIVDAYAIIGITGEHSSVRGWVFDSSGVIYREFLGGCLLELPSYDGDVCFISVPQPLIKLIVPKQYLSTKKTLD